MLSNTRQHQGAQPNIYALVTTYRSSCPVLSKVGSGLRDEEHTAARHRFGSEGLSWLAIPTELNSAMHRPRALPLYFKRTRRQRSASSLAASTTQRDSNSTVTVCCRIGLYGIKRAGSADAGMAGLRCFLTARPGPIPLAARGLAAVLARAASAGRGGGGKLP